MMDSIITEEKNFCILCSGIATDTHHLCYGRSGRALSDDFGLVIPVCRSCHNLIHSDTRIGQLSKMLGQMAWEKKYGNRDDFRKTFGKSYC